MKSNSKMIAAAVFAVLLMGTFTLRAEAAAAPANGAKDGKAVDSSVAFVADPAALPYAPMPVGSMAAAMPYSGGLNIGVPRFELFAGYSYLRAVPTLAAGNRLMWMNGGSASIAFNVNRYLGLVADFGAYTNSEMRFTGAYTSTVDVNNANVAAFSYLFGPRVSFRKFDRVTPFLQVLAGGAHANQVTLTGCTFSCTLLPTQDTFAMTAGGGLDVRIHRHLAIRVIQAEYLMTRFTSYTTGAAGTQNDMRLSSGIVFRFGGNPRVPEMPPVTYSCSVDPAAVYPGDPIAVSGTALNLDPAKTATYTWSADGGTVTGTSSSASIDTKGVTPGTYTLKGHVSEGGKPAENADCTTPYVVKAFEPLTISCTADPSTLISGGTSTITAVGISPQNRPLTYTFSSNAGSVIGTGSTAALTTTGAPTGAIAVTCNVVDDKGHGASATTSVTVEAPVAAPRPLTSDQCSVHFDRDPRRPSRVDNEAKACLDEVALNLQSNPDAHLAIVGNAAGGEKDGQKLAAERAVNTKAYLVGEKGIDSTRISVYTGSQDGKIVSITLIPADATFDATGDSPVQ
jgi:outer membrane protein OmpA-like peptidoglycan-associated protein